MCFPKTVRTALEMSERKRKKETETGGGMKKKQKVVLMWKNNPRK